VTTYPEYKTLPFSVSFLFLCSCLWKKLLINQI